MAKKKRNSIRFRNCDLPDYHEPHIRPPGPDEHFIHYEGEPIIIVIEWLVCTGSGTNFGS